MKLCFVRETRCTQKEFSPVFVYPVIQNIQSSTHTTIVLKKIDFAAATQLTSTQETSRITLHWSGRHLTTKYLARNSVPL